MYINGQNFLDIHKNNNLEASYSDADSFTRHETSCHVTSQMTFALFSPEKSFWIPILNGIKHLKTSKLAALTVTAAEV